MRAAGAAAVLAATAGVVAFHGISASSAQSPATTITIPSNGPPTTAVGSPTTVTVPIPATTVPIGPTTSTSPPREADRREIQRQRAAAAAAARPVVARPQFTG
jgi:hypothetical protein